MTSEATKIVIRGNMHMDTRTIRVADFKSKFKFQIEAYWSLEVIEIACNLNLTNERSFKALEPW